MSPGELLMEAARNNSCVITIVGYHGNSVYRVPVEGSHTSVLMFPHAENFAVQFYKIFLFFVVVTLPVKYDGENPFYILSFLSMAFLVISFPSHPPSPSG
jgi:hypothetical protein